MIRMISILIIFLIFAFFGVWLKQHDFVISGTYEGYEIKTSAARLMVMITFFTITFYGFLKFMAWVKASPARITGRLEKNNREEGLKNLMQGFSALAAGDVEHAEKLASRSEKALKEQPLVKLLKAQIAVVSHKPVEAEKMYSELQANEDSKFLGYRGLISQAIENGELDRALDLAEDLLKLNKKSSWINESVIDLSFRNMDWNKAEEYTKRAQNNGSITKTEAKVNLSLAYYLKAKDSYELEKPEQAISELEASIKNNSKFLPASLLLTEILIASDQEKKAISVIKKQWKICPHSALGNTYYRIFDELSPENKVKKVKQLAKANKDAVESMVLLAKAYIAAGEKEKAKGELKKASKIRETKDVCRLMGKIDLSVDWSKRAENAESDKCWHCPQTGVCYSDWQLYSESGYFNSIIWDYPQKHSDFSMTKINRDDNFLLIK